MPETFTKVGDINPTNTRFNKRWSGPKPFAGSNFRGETSLAKRGKVKTESKSPSKGGAKSTTVTADEKPESNNVTAAQARDWYNELTREQEKLADALIDREVEEMGYEDGDIKRDAAPWCEAQRIVATRFLREGATW